eukprot:SAG11_NODE_5943_length_1428_cov_1.758465_1_plen_173_part_00
MRMEYALLFQQESARNHALEQAVAEHERRAAAMAFAHEELLSSAESELEDAVAEHKQRLAAMTDAHEARRRARTESDVAACAAHERQTARLEAVSAAKVAEVAKAAEVAKVSQEVALAEGTPSRKKDLKRDEFWSSHRARIAALHKMSPPKSGVARIQAQHETKTRVNAKSS